MKEELVHAEAAKGADSARGGFALPRLSLLTICKEHDPAAIRVGDEEKPAVRYTVGRADVGRWMYEQLIAGDASKWNGRRPTLTC